MDTMDCGLVSVGANPLFPHLREKINKKKNNNKNNRTKSSKFFSLNIKSSI